MTTIMDSMVFRNKCKLRCLAKSIVEASHSSFVVKDIVISSQPDMPKTTREKRTPTDIIINFNVVGSLLEGKQIFGIEGSQV